MVQFDFFIISSVTILGAALFILYLFFTLFYVAAKTWLSGAIKLMFKAELINEAKLLRAILNSAPALVSADLLEQFIFIVNSKMAKLLILAVLLSLVAFSLLVLTRLLSSIGDFVANLISDVSQGAAAAMGRNWTVLCCVFVVVMTSNLLGMMPFSFTTTSSIAIPFFFSIAVFFAYFFNIIQKNGFSFFAGFLPAGTNVFIAPLIILIEVVSTLAKFVSLGVRLFANMFAGHLLLKVFYSIAFYAITTISFFLGLAESFVVFFLLVITLMEIMIACLQAFVMLLLIVLYVRESEHFASNH